MDIFGNACVHVKLPSPAPQCTLIAGALRRPALRAVRRAGIKCSATRRHCPFPSPHSTVTPPQFTSSTGRWVGAGPTCALLRRSALLDRHGAPCSPQQAWALLCSVYSEPCGQPPACGSLAPPHPLPVGWANRVCTVAVRSTHWTLLWQRPMPVMRLDSLWSRSGAPAPTGTGQPAAMVKRNVADLKPEELAGKVVFVRADLNVPQVRVPRREPPRRRHPRAASRQGCVSSSVACIGNRLSSQCSKLEQHCTHEANACAASQPASRARAPAPASTLNTAPPCPALHLPLPCFSPAPAAGQGHSGHHR